jgi:NAD-dependent deacetylase
MPEATTVDAASLAAARSLASRLAGLPSLLVLTGAGVSAESGVPTFRGPEGLWRSFRPEELATPEAFARDPRLVWEWYAWRRERIAPLAPNAAHEAIVGLERRGGEFLLATQNVDGLHALAGSRLMVELHGSLWWMRCVGCGRSEEDRRVPLPELPPRCAACGALVRPDVVWFGESLPAAALEAAFAAAQRADVVLAIGTSSLVYPAAALPRVARAHGAFVVEVNPEATPLTPLASLALRGKAAELLPLMLEGA